MNLSALFSFFWRKKVIVYSLITQPFLSPEEAQGIQLIDFFVSEQAYHFVTAILRNKNFIGAHSEIWIDSKKCSKKMLIVLLKKLRVLGYYKNNHTLTAKEIQEISMNTFGIHVSISHINHVDYLDMPLHFIPDFATIVQNK